MKGNTRGFTLIEMLVVLGIIAVLFVLIMPAIASTRESARTVSCLNNMKQLALAAFMYADDHGERIPDVSETELGSYIDDTEVYLCPRDDQTPSYRAYNGTPDTLLPSDVGGLFSEQILYIETDNENDKGSIKLTDESGDIDKGDIALRHDNRTVIAYLDGHVMGFTKEQLITMASPIPPVGGSGGEVPAE